MRYEVLRLVPVAALSACALPPVQDIAFSGEDVLVHTANRVETPALPCMTPMHLVRDLTVSWGARRYVIGLCSTPEAPAVSTTPTAPGLPGADIELSTGGEALP